MTLRSGSPSVVEYQAQFGQTLANDHKRDLSPQAIALDSSGTLYVANGSARGRGSISVYPPGVSDSELRDQERGGLCELVDG